jgi:hypothetical protein
MKTYLYLSFALFGTLFLASCYSSSMLVDDDVYVLKNQALPIGESLTDETSYTTFKSRQKRNTTASNYYRDDRNYLYNSSCNHFSIDRFGFGCSFYSWNFYSHNFYPNRFYPSYYAYDPYFYGSYGFYPAGFYAFPMNTIGFYGGMMYNSGPIVFTIPEIHTNQHSGPRGSISGFGNAANRNSNPIVLKSANPPSAAGNKPVSTILRDRSIGSQRESTGATETQNRPVRSESNTYRPSGERNQRPATQNRPAGNRPVGIERPTAPNREINPPRQNREINPTQNRGGNNSRGGSGNAPSHKRN